MITSKQRAKLKGLANPIDTIVHVGKGGITQTVVIQVKEALLARELIKGRVLENAPILPQEAAAILSEKTQAEVVQVIGTKFVLYKKHPKKPVIQLD